MPAADFCREEGVSRAGFYAWRRRLEEVEPRQAPAIEFVERPASSGTTPTVLEVGEVVLRLARGVDGADPVLASGSGGGMSMQSVADHGKREN